MAESLQVEMNLRLICWNISGVKYNLCFLHQILKDCDICCIQEHWLFPDDFRFLDTVNPKFDTWGRCDSRLSLDSLSRRGKGGLAFFWRKSLMASVEVLENIGNDRIAAISVKQHESEQMFLVGTYLPCATESMEVYNSYVEQLENVLYQLQQRGTIIIMGDINAHIGHLGGPRSFGKVNSRGCNFMKIINDFDLLSVNSQPVLDQLKHIIITKVALKLP